MHLGKIGHSTVKCLWGTYCWDHHTTQAMHQSTQVQKGAGFRVKKGAGFRVIILFLLLLGNVVVAQGMQQERADKKLFFFISFFFSHLALGTN